MKLLFHTPSKRGVTRVTDVTKHFNSLNIKGLFEVTHHHAQHSTTCYEIKSCNNASPATSLLVEDAAVLNRCIRDTDWGQGAVDGQ